MLLRNATKKCYQGYLALLMLLRNTIKYYYLLLMLQRNTTKYYYLLLMLLRNATKDTGYY